MNAVLPLEIPIEFQQILAAKTGQAEMPRWALEALVMEAVREGFISRGFGGEVLGLGFTERENFYAKRGILYELSPEALQADLDTLTSILRPK